ncbi:MAG TPA: hypothetical protein VFH03_17440 [Actinoplanes sp.]|nr:hypothetical protein [Actinoplanes sp.]
MTAARTITDGPETFRPAWSATGRSRWEDAMPTVTPLVDRT